LGADPRSPRLPAAYADSAGVASVNSSAGASVADTDLQPSLEEVTVEAHKLKLSKLRQLINKSVDNFYDTFDKINTVPGYDTTCSDERRESSYVKHHVCTPRFVHDATQDETQGYFYGYATIPAASLVMLRMPGYKETLESLIHSDPRLRQAALDFEALKERYDAVSKEKVKAN
jgi:hypothetical protein